jgi:pimeloyl-ACP methyl ester carboxylesterase
MTSDLHVDRTGSGVSVLFVHGLDSSGEVWGRVVERLGDHTCITVDLPGHGYSPISEDPSDYQRDALLRDLDEVLDDIDGPVVLVGHSLGGYLGMAYAITRPDALAALVLVASGPGFRDADARERWNTQVRRGVADYGIPEVAAAVAFHTDSMVIDRMSEITIPVTLLIGDQDTAYLGANDYMQRKLPHARRTTVEGARHYVMRSHPDDVAASIRSMTTSLEA